MRLARYLAFGFLVLVPCVCIAQTSDLYPPEVNWTSPVPGETLYFNGTTWIRPATMDSQFSVHWYDPTPSSGVDTLSLHIKVRLCADTVWTLVSGYDVGFGFEYGHAWGAFDLLGLEGGNCYELGCWISDYSGNQGFGSVVFYTAPLEGDICPPMVVDWQPPDTVCLPRDSWLEVVVCDNTLDCEVATGVNPATANVVLTVGEGPATNITDQCTFTPGAMHCLVVHWPHPGEPFPPLVPVTLCISIADSAGNFMDMQCNTWETCELSDTCPPQVNFTAPIDGETLYFDGERWWCGVGPDTLWHANISDYSCYSYGLDTSSVNVWLIDCYMEDTVYVDDFWAFWGYDYGSVSGPLASLGLDFLGCYSLCLSVRDLAGNVGEGCVTFYTPPPPDECPPYVVDLVPAEGETLCPPDAPIHFMAIDPTTPECMCSGILLDGAYTHFTLITPETTYYLAPDYGAGYDPFSSCSVYFWLDTAYYDLDFGAEVTLVLDIYDYEWNWYHDTVSFYVCSPSLEDTCPPYVSEWHPAEGETLCPPDGSIWFHVVDPHGDGCICSGIIYVEAELSVPGGVYILTEGAGLFRDGDSCSALFVLDTSYYSIPYGVSVNLLVHAYDGAGHVLWDDVDFYVCSPPPEDTCAPFVDHWFPPSDSCIMPDATLGVLICDDDACPLSGVVPGSVSVSISVGGGEPVDVTDDCYFDSAGYGCLYVVWTPDSASPLPEGADVMMCVRAADGAGNVLEDCNTWYVCGGVEEDTCPPYVSEWHPAEGETLCPPDGSIWFHVVDPHGDGCICSGIIYVEAELSVPGGVYILTEGAGLFRDGDSCSALFVLDTSYYSIPYGVSVNLLVHAYDGAGHVLWDDVDFYVCSPPPEDTCAPFVDHWFPPSDSCIMPDATLGVLICDDDACPLSGVVPGSVSVSISVGGGEPVDVTDDCYFDSAGYGCLYVVWTPDSASPLPEGADVMMCVRAADGAGNVLEDCNTWYVCGGVEEDVCPPAVVEWLPEGCIPPGGGWAVYIVDPCDSFECPVATGVDTLNFAVTLAVGSDTLDVTGECEASSWGGYGLVLEWYPVGWSLPPDVDVTVCVTVRDYAGNVGEDCHTYHTCPAETLDACAPYVLDWHPSEGDTLCAPFGPIWFRVVDPVDSVECPICSGVDVSSVEVELFNAGHTFVLTVGAGLLYEPVWECVTDFVLDDAYYYLELGTGATLCVSGADNAGNDFFDCITFVVCDTGHVPVDTCPPVVEWATPLEGDTLVFYEGSWHALSHGDTMFWVGFSEFGCPPSGLADGSVHIYVAPCGGEAVEVDGYDFYLSWDYGAAWGSFELLGLEPGGCYWLCAHVADSAGNESESCVTFFTAELPETADYCPPVVTSWFPEVDTCLPVESALGFVLVDPEGGECGFASGVDTSTMVVTVTFGYDSAFDITGQCEVVVSEGGVGVEWHHAGMLLPECERVLLCVSAADHAGNDMEACYDWHTCCPVETVDVCPPVAELELPDTAECIPADTGVLVVDVYDPFDYEECPVVTGVDESTVTVTVVVDDNPPLDVTADCALVPLGSGYRISWIYGGLPEGEDVTLCVAAADHAGNWLDPSACFTWHTCPPAETTDVWPPCFSDWHPADGEENVPLEANVTLSICDLCEGSGFATGVDTASIEAHMFAVTSDDDTVEISFEMYLEPIYCAGYAVMLVPLDGLPACADVYVHVVAGDYAGNVSDDGVHFSTYCAPETVDVWPPCVYDVVPAPGSEVVPPVSVGAALCDLCPGAEFATGVDSSTIRMTVNGEDVTDELGFAPLDCYGWGVYWYADWLPGGEYEVRLWGADFAGNLVDTCWSFTVIVPDTLVEVEVLEPEDSAWTSCVDQHIVALFVDGVPAGEFTFTVDGETYSLTSPEVELLGDTMVFVPSEPFDEGWHWYHIGTAWGHFGVDTTAPEITIAHCGDTLDAPPDLITIHFVDDGAGVDEASVVVTISSAVFTVDSPGVSWDPEHGVFSIDPVEAGLDLEGEVEVCGAANDAPDYCEPNAALTCCSFWVISPATYVVAGFVTDTVADEPVEGVHIIGLHFLGAPFVVRTTTDADGFFCFNLTEGVWFFALFDSTFTYPPVFWDGHFYPFDADPVVLDASVTDTVWVNFDVAPIMHSFYRISGGVEDESGSTIRGAFVVAIATADDDDDEELSVSFGISDEMGHFELPAKSGGSYYLMAYARGFAPAFVGAGWHWDSADTFAVEGDVTGVNFVLGSTLPDTGAYTVFGTVYREVPTAFDVEPFRGVMVCLCDVASGEPLYCGLSDTDGGYEIEGVPAGVYRLEAERAFYVCQGEWYNVDASDSLPHDIYLQHYTAGIVEGGKVPKEAVIVGARPNPFNEATSVEFFVPSGGSVELDIVDISGRTVDRLLSGFVPAGRYVAVWDARGLSSGVYFARLRAGGRESLLRLLLVR